VCRFTIKRADRTHWRNTDHLMTVRLLLISHASTAALTRAAFGSGDPLDERGRREAAALAETIPGERAGVCGPAASCRQTAEELGLTVRIDPALRDCDYGRWTGRSLAEVQAEEPEAVRAWLTDPAAAPHDGESVLDVIARTAAWLGELTDGRLLAVTHPVQLRAAVIHALGAPAASFWHIDIEPLAHISLTRHADRWKLRFSRPA
jgi:broad specificity phosphatase PhoE